MGIAVYLGTRRRLFGDVAFANSSDKPFTLGSPIVRIQVFSAREDKL